MDKALKQRMVGAIVLIALGVIFIPMLLDGGARDGSRTVELDIPEPPEQDYRSRLLPLDEEDAASGERDESTGRVARETGTPETTMEQGASDSSKPESEPEPSGEQPTPRPAPPEPEPETDPEPEPESAEPATGDEAQGGSRAAAPLGNWFVQVGSFSRQENAGDLRNQLRDKGYTAFVETSTVEGKTTHRVKVGPEMDRARAERVRDEIQAAMDLKGIVVSEP